MTSVHKNEQRGFAVCVGGGASSYLWPLTAIVKFNTCVVSFPSVVI